MFEIEFASGDGRGRNTDYTDGVTVVLTRLGQMEAVLVSARISSLGSRASARAKSQYQGCGRGEWDPIDATVTPDDHRSRAPARAS